MTKVFEHDLILEEEKTFNESIKVKGSIKRKEGTYRRLTVKGDIDADSIDADSIDAWDIDAGDIDAWDIDAGDIDADSIDAGDIDADSIDAGDISYYAFCISRQSLKCTSIEGRRDKSIHKCLDSEIEIKDKEEVCDCCGQKIKGDPSVE